MVCKAIRLASFLPAECYQWRGGQPFDDAIRQRAPSFAPKNVRYRLDESDGSLATLKPAFNARIGYANISSMAFIAGGDNFSGAHGFSPWAARAAIASGFEH